MWPISKGREQFLCWTGTRGITQQLARNKEEHPAVRTERWFHCGYHSLATFQDASSHSSPTLALVATHVLSGKNMQEDTNIQEGRGEQAYEQLKSEEHTIQTWGRTQNLTFTHEEPRHTSEQALGPVVPRLRYSVGPRVSACPQRVSPPIPLAGEGKELGARLEEHLISWVRNERYQQEAQEQAKGGSLGTKGTLGRRSCESSPSLRTRMILRGRDCNNRRRREHLHGGKNRKRAEVGPEVEERVQDRKEMK